MIETIKTDLRHLLKNDLNIENVVLEMPKRGDSDLAIPLFGYQKTLGKKLNEIYELFSNVLIKSDYIDRVEFIAGFLNIYIKRAPFSKRVLDKIHKEKSNFGSRNDNNETIVIDYSSPNIAKSFSVGHLRSTVIGNSLKLIYKKLGYNVVGVNHLGDWGTQFGSMIVAYKKWGNKELIQSNPIDELQRLYVRFHEEAEKDPSLSQEARDAFLKLEQNDPEYIELWTYFKNESLKEFKEMYDLLDVTFDSYNGEAFYNDKMDDVVKELEEKNLLVEDQGAMVVRISEDQPPVLIKRSDGATLYTTRDLAALFYRLKTYDFKKVIYVVGNEQKLHFDNLKKVTQLMGYDFDIEHVNFGLVLQDGKKMSTRKGKTTKLNYVLNEAVLKAKSAIEEKNPSLDDKDNVAKVIGIGAIIFNDLKNDRTLDIEFNLDNMLKFEGQTGPYLLYSIVRIFSILKQGELDFNEVDYKIYNDSNYFGIIKTLDQFPNIVQKAANESSPSVIAKYLLGLSQEFNGFYAKVKINDSNDVLRNTNLLLIESILNVLIEGLRLLGMKHLEAM
ncbi:arginine--tRNA ligase [Acholeplasma granularum]|uniref:arginine--tRNA ligase n=1 Tax=Acholeplasma granularum TaxID=264635 RepID=UPI0004713425|nr:arginine--tRNA ligase [Acholeplasma granularum]